MPLSIPTTIHAATVEEPLTVAFYGDPKIGKSETTAKLGEPVPGNLLHVDTHHGALHLRTRRVEIGSLADLKELRPAMDAAWKEHPFRFVCVDVLDDVESWALEEAEAEYRRRPVGKNFGGQSILELDRGLGYGYLRDAFMKLAYPLFGNSRWSTIFLVHSRAKYLDATMSTEANSEQLDLTGKVRKLVCNRVDAVGHWVKTPQGKLTLDFRTKEKVICGLRARYLHNKVVEFSDPAKPEEWAAVWPKTWNQPAGAAAPASTPPPAPTP